MRMKTKTKTNKQMHVGDGFHKHHMNDFCLFVRERLNEWLREMKPNSKNQLNKTIENQTFI